MWITKESKTRGIDFDFVVFLIVALLVGILLLQQAQVFAREICPIRIDDKTVVRVPVTTRGTVLSFPVKPENVLLGKNGAFAIVYVKNDLAITPLGAASRSNLFVYLEGRRFTFDLITEPTSGCTLVPVRDSTDVQTRVDFKER